MKIVYFLFIINLIIWAALLYKKYGLDFSTQVLSAHEQNPRQTKAEKAMDLANNRLGQLSAERLTRKNKFNDKNLLDSFKTNLKLKRFIILKETEGENK